MRAAALALITLALMLLIVAWYPGYVERPLKDGPGPLSVYMDPSLPAPEYHSPLDWWQTHHADVVNRGDLIQSDCLQCHEPATSCNNCHSYVGAKAVVP